MSDTRTHPKKAWALLVFMAGDNDLESFAHLDLMEMESLSSDEHIHVVVQFDSRAEATYRFRFFPGGHEMVGKPLDEVNTGDPAMLTQFVTWGKRLFPAEKTALVIWNHGTGLRKLPDDFDYSKLLRSGEVEVAQNELRRTLFSPTLLELAQTRRRMRGVAIDATDRDYLDNKELQKALTDVPGDGARVDLIGFDACLMSAVEIGYQLRDVARFMVGSQELEPGTGWPYGEILNALAANPDMSMREMAETVVDTYIRTTGRRMRGRESRYTQSALDLSKVDQTFGLISKLVQALLDTQVFGHSKVQRALHSSRKEAKRFHYRKTRDDRELADLLDWCELLRRGTKGRASEPFREVLVALQAHLAPGAGLVIASRAHGGDDADRIHGVSIYWPQKVNSSIYDGLDFAASNWGQLIKKVVDL